MFKGPYKTELVSLEQCKGPKKGECTILNLYTTPDKSSVQFILDIQKECPIKNVRNYWLTYDIEISN